MSEEKALALDEAAAAYEYRSPKRSVVTGWLRARAAAIRRGDLYTPEELR